MEQLLTKIPTAVYIAIIVFFFGLIVGLVSYVFKGIISSMKDMSSNIKKLQDYDNENKIALNNIKNDIKSDREKISEILPQLRSHEEGIKANRKDIDTIIVTHNSTKCTRMTEIPTP